jgi:hypothetical protein
MYTLKKLIICVFLAQFASSCSASLPEQCKQLKTIQEAYTEKKDPVPSRQLEIFSEQFSKKSKDIEKLSISDKDLKGIQQRFVTNYDSQAKRSLTQSAIAKQLEIIESEPESIDKTRRFLAVVKQGNEPSDKLIVLLKENSAIISDMEKICSSK